MSVCDKCGDELSYSVDDDCLYCAVCNEWKENKCGDSNCDFCQNRPEKPDSKKMSALLQTNKFTISVNAFLNTFNQSVIGNRYV